MLGTKVLLIYTGGTIGMIKDSETGALKPFDFEQIKKEVPELYKFECEIDTISFESPLDSSNMEPEVWVRIAEIIEENYNDYDGFVILHGSDTMAFTASALSFMLHGLNKPVILTGSQLPIGTIRTDGKENLITAIEIAVAKKANNPIVPEVAIYFEYNLYRGNRTTKMNSEDFEAFDSFNFPLLAEAGVKIKYNTRNILEVKTESRLNVFKSFDRNVASLKLFPGITKEFVSHFIKTPGLKAIVLETFGSGNAMSEEWFLTLLKQAIDKGVVIVNVTQCKGGGVDQSKYEAGSRLEAIGVISGADITFEAATTKLMLLLGGKTSTEKIKTKFLSPFCGEIS
ncbi:MAG: asparaginase [Flavobacteriales bacterium]|nr:asparaginase [Flavobacteriales bacterium]